MRRVVQWFKRLGVFGAGVLVGTVYGSIVATLTAYMMLRVVLE